MAERKPRKYIRKKKTGKKATKKIGKKAGKKKLVPMQRTVRSNAVTATGKPVDRSYQPKGHSRSTPIDRNRQRLNATRSRKASPYTMTRSDGSVVRNYTPAGGGGRTTPPPVPMKAREVTKGGAKTLKEATGVPKGATKKTAAHTMGKTFQQRAAKLGQQGLGLVKKNPKAAAGIAVGTAALGGLATYLGTRDGGKKPPANTGQVDTPNTGVTNKSIGKAAPPPAVVQPPKRRKTMGGGRRNAITKGNPNRASRPSTKQANLPNQTNWTNTTQEWMKANPLASAGIAAGIGGLAGYLLAGGRKKRRRGITATNYTSNTYNYY